MSIKRHASAHWSGNLKEGKGTISSDSGALSDQPFGFNTRFEDKNGTNPEELIGAAHAGCFAMAFANELSSLDVVPNDVSTKATVQLEEIDGGFKITRSDIDVTLDAPGADRSVIDKAFKAAEDGCPVSNALNAEVKVTLTVK
ncbi:OsmC family protein [Litorimonas haliclonae]|uniref:OsmC family protein n=1 Tax=Litorimonas haliclonae TaxID=2081977 RepID=UPI0039EFB25D